MSSTPACDPPMARGRIARLRADGGRRPRSRTRAAHDPEDLRRAQIEPFAWVINSSLAPTGSTDPCLRQRIAAELCRNAG
jgi:hypothetical protein